LALGAAFVPALAAGAAALYAAVLLAAHRIGRYDARRRARVAALREARDFNARLLQSLNDAILVQDPGGQVVEVNQRWCDLVGRPREELIGQVPPYPWQADPDPAPADAQRLLRRADGTLVPVLATTAPVLDQAGQARAYVATFTDISARVHAQEAVEARAAQLEQANEDLRKANEELARAAGFKSDLVDMVSHELSQPLSSMVSLAELLVSDWEQLPEDIRLDLATKIDRNTGRLAGMLNDLMLLFRLDAGKVSARPVPVPVKPLLEAVAERLASTMDVAAFVEPELAVLADREHLRQVLTHLLTNAAEFGGPPIEFSARKRPDGVVLAVRDQGTGIPAELVPQLFQRFTRAGTVGASGRKGTGLGLFIAGHLVRINGGDIWYEPVVPHGACLIVRLAPAP
ncbi:MAG TPA: PAS domain-containing sensor histidine kinase, partial [Rugosimonospora sp.]|nr:PAS domain-containing sensor histidine kinase [Rugosimonospora sp.]